MTGRTKKSSQFLSLQSSLLAHDGKSCSQNKKLEELMTTLVTEEHEEEEDDCDGDIIEGGLIGVCWTEYSHDDAEEDCSQEEENICAVQTRNGAKGKQVQKGQDQPSIQSCLILSSGFSFSNYPGQ